MGQKKRDALQEYDSLPAGNWTFAVMAADAAGNAEAQPQSAAPWQVDMSAFVQVSGGDAGATITGQAQHATEPFSTAKLGAHACGQTNPTRLTLARGIALLQISMKREPWSQFASHAMNSMDVTAAFGHLIAC